MNDTIKDAYPRDYPGTSKEMVDQMLQNLLKETRNPSKLSPEFINNTIEVAHVPQVESTILPHDIKLETEQDEPQIELQACFTENAAVIGSDGGALDCLITKTLPKKTQTMVELIEGESVAKIEEINVLPFEDLIKKEKEEKLTYIRIHNTLPENTETTVKLEESIAEIEEVNVPQYEDLKIEIEEIIKKTEEEKVTVIKIGMLADLPKFLSGTQPLNNIEGRERNNQEEYTIGLACDVQTICKSEFENLNLQPVEIVQESPKRKRKRKTKHKCDDCDFVTNSKINLEIHRVKHEQPTEIGFFQCHHCMYNTNGKDNLLLHFRLHHNRYKCDRCQYSTNWRSSFNEHRYIHRPYIPDSVYSYRCDSCTYQTNYEGRMRRHIGKHRRTELVKFKCNQCPYATDRKFKLKFHLSIHKELEEADKSKSEDATNREEIDQSKCEDATIICESDLVKEFKCSQCEYATAFETSLKGHVLTHKKRKEVFRFRCDMCKYTTIWQRNMKHHLSNHKKKRKPRILLKCDRCTFATAYESKLKFHLYQHQDSEDATKYKCDKCEYVTAHKHRLNFHVLIHKNPKEFTRIKTYKSTDEFKKFSKSYRYDKYDATSEESESNVRRFLRRKIARKVTKKAGEYKCPLCEYVATYRDELHAHNNLKHTNSEGKFKCDNCNYTTYLKGSLKTHLIRHKSPDEVRKFRCDQCEYVSLQKGALKTHILIKHINVFRCAQCEYVSNHKSNLANHISRKHNRPHSLTLNPGVSI